MDYDEFNFQLESCKQDLINILNNSKMPIGALYYIIKDIYIELNNQYMTSINSYSIKNPKEAKDVISNIEIPTDTDLQV